ncbi:hypothetical protein [Rossellomorea sp. FM04394]|uniref:hypothetical protein n=1 Tax=Rossellomorea sp. FM04394 TaxID=3243076 RepID=UPI0035A59A04
MVAFNLLVGVVAAFVLQALQKYGKIHSFFNAKLFFVLILLSTAWWLVGLAIGGWGGMSLNKMGLVALFISLSGLMTSFLLNMVMGE